MEQSLPKAFVALNNVPLIRYSIETFSKCANICEIILVVPPALKEAPLQEALNELESQTQSILKIVVGGSERQDSSMAGVEAANSDWVLVHDAARPFFSISLIEKLTTTALKNRAAIPTIPVADSLRTIDANRMVVSDVDRSKLHTVQTPQCYERQLLLSALQAAQANARYFTDEAAAVMEYSNIQVHSVPGEPMNFKITTPWDLQLAHQILKFQDPRS